VKSSFTRNAGRVTELVAKPLLSIFFPELLAYNQPLSGMIAGKKTLLQKLDFREDFGVDIGLLIDMYLMKVRMVDVEIGYIENKSKPWRELGKMSKEVAQAIISKGTSSKKTPSLVEEAGEQNEILSQMQYAFKDELRKLNKLIVFDMDNTILRGRFIDTCADAFGFMDQLLEIRSSEKDNISRSKQIATYLTGKSLAHLIAVSDTIPIVEGTNEIVSELKKQGYIVGIISDSYNCITEHLKNKLEMDFSLSNELEFSKSLCTGEVKIPSFFFSNPNSLCKHTFCKTNALSGILNKYHIEKENCIAIGDSLSDLCMIKEAGIGIAFCSDNDLLNSQADVVISTPSFNELLNHTTYPSSQSPISNPIHRFISTIFKRGNTFN